jgi:hypothetical protein
LNEAGDLRSRRREIKRRVPPASGHWRWRRRRLISGASLREGNHAMIVEMRTYTLQVAAVPQYMKIYEAEGLAIQKRILGHLVGWYHTEIGGLNQIVHMWAYDSFEERLKRRAALHQDPGWQAYIAKIKALVVTQENKILNPAPFAPPPKIA